MYRPIVIIGAAVAFVAGGLVTSSVQAASYATVKTIPTKVVPHGGTATIKPIVSLRKSKASSKRLTVKRGSTYVARNATSVRLPAGSYRVTTTVRYRVKTKKGKLGTARSTSRTQDLAVKVDPATVPAAEPATKPAESVVPAPTPSTPPPTTPAPSTPAPAPVPISSLATTGSPCDATSLVKPDGTRWSCTFSDEFDGSTLDQRKWVAQQTATSGYQNGGECFVDDPDNIAVLGGALRLTVRQEAEPFTCSSPLGDTETSYTAGMVSTWGLFTQTFGRYEIRASFPTNDRPGLHSALWLWPQDVSKHGAAAGTGEIDIAEMFSQYSDRVIPYLHYTRAENGDPVTNNYCMVQDVHRFHTYTLEWTPTKISIAYDGRTCLEHTINPLAPLSGPAPFDHPYLVALTQALGLGTNARTGSIDGGSASMWVDYVRVWE